MATPDPTPKPTATPDPTPVVTPDPTPVVTPDPTPDPTPVVTPDPTPDPTPVVTPACDDDEHPHGSFCYPDHEDSECPDGQRIQGHDTCVDICDNSNEHPYTTVVGSSSVTRCHTGDHKCPDGQDYTSRDSHGHVSGCGTVGKICPSGTYKTLNASHGVNSPPFDPSWGSWWKRADPPSSPDSYRYSCWTLHKATCPKGTIMAVGGWVHGWTPAPPDGYTFDYDSSSPGQGASTYSYNIHGYYQCWKLVNKPGSPLSIDKFIDVGEAIAGGLKTAYDATMKAICTETGQFLTESLAGLAVTAASGGNIYVGIGSALIIDKALEYQCSQRRSSYGTHQDAVLKAGCTSTGKFTASSVTGMAINYKSPKTYFVTLYEYGGSLLSGEFLESACETLSTDPDANPTPPAPFRTPTPTPPPTLSLSAGDGRLSVSWSASADVPADGFGYRVQWKTAGQTWAGSEAASQFEDLDHGDDLATSYTVTGLVNGSAYGVRVAAFNDNGFSDWVDETAAPAAVPGPASGLSLSGGDKQIAVSWTASGDTPGAGFGYRVQWARFGQSSQSWAESEAASQFEDLDHGDDLATSYTIGGLWDTASYLVRVAAFNGDGYSDWVTNMASTLRLSPPSGLKLSGGDKQIAVSWSASAETPGAGFGYRVQWKKAGDGWGGENQAYKDLRHGVDLATSHTIGGLANGSAYDVRVAAFSLGGFSKVIDGTATPAKPKPKASLSLTSYSCASSGSGWVVSVSWDVTPADMAVDVYVSEVKTRGHREYRKGITSTSAAFDVPRANWYQISIQAKPAGPEKKVGESKPVRCRPPSP